jgi:hypothetical protein
VNTAAVKTSDRELLAIPKAEWATAKRKERIAKVALRTDVEAAAELAGCSTRTIRRMVARYRVDPSLLAFLTRKRGFKAGSRRLDVEREFRGLVNPLALYKPTILQSISSSPMTSIDFPVAGLGSR